MSFCGSTHGCAHIRLVFIGHGFTCLVHNRSSSHTCTGTHKNLITSNSNQSSGRSSIIIYKTINRQIGIQNFSTYRISIQNLATISIHIDKNSICMLFFCFLKTLLCVNPSSATNLFPNIYAIIYCNIGFSQDEKQSMKC